MICPKCKNNIPDNSAFCNMCGLQFTPVARPKKKMSNSAVGCLGFFVIIVLIVIIVAATSGGDKNTVTTNAELKTQAEYTMESFNKIDHDFIIICNEYKKITSQMGNESTSSTYGQINDLITLTNALFIECSNLQLGKEYNDGKYEFLTGISCLKTSMENLNKYLDEGKPSQINEATEKLKSAVQYRISALIKITGQAVTDGYVEKKDDAKTDSTNSLP